ncbi:MAG: GTPase Era [Desulfovibrio sp.]|nr:GTPase Era [Desulfovibrio sp.]
MISENAPAKARCGWVALMGPPNAGKSTLLNALLGQKVTIVTPKPQTTRNQVVGILTEENVQAVFMDTPGLSQVRGRLSKTMIQAVWESLRQADVIMPVIDANLYVRHPEALERDLAPVAQALAADERPMIVVVNKIDLFADKSLMLPLLTKLNEMWPKAEIFPASALMKDGLPELRRLLAAALPEGEALFPEDQISTAPVRFMVSEIIREKLFLHLRQEVPYSVAVDVENWEEDEESGRTIINAVIYVARQMHKAMVIGHAGATIKQIGTEARRDIQTLLERKVHLELWVKVREHWTEDTAFLRDLGLLPESL